MERVAGGGGGDVDGAVDLVELAEYDGGECGVCGGGCDLAVARVEAVERDGVARVYRDHRWDAGSCVWMRSSCDKPFHESACVPVIPCQMVVCAFHGMNAGHC